MNADKVGVTHCWENTQLLRAWERAVQVEASGKVKDLFPNLANIPTVDITTPHNEAEGDDEDAGELGKPFTQYPSSRHSAWAMLTATRSGFTM